MNYQTIILSIGCILLLVSCSKNKNESPYQYLFTVLSNLEEIESATFTTRAESWSPGDTVPSGIYYSYLETYNNPADTTLGASWVRWSSQDTSQLKSVYDGKMHVAVYEEHKGIMIDSFNTRDLPFRPVTVPFYNYTQDLLEYILSTKDSITLKLNELSDTIHVKLTIHEDRQVEFFGKAHYMPESPYGYQDPTSRYELWIDKSTNLPFKKRRKMEHNISVESVSEAKFNTLELENFIAASYFPAGYEIRVKGKTKRVRNPHELIGEKAPNWLLTDEYGEKLGLNDFDSKVLLVQFTSVNCGPCRASIPFLNTLSAEYNRADFDLVAIESYTNNTNVLSTYRQRTGLDYKFLMSEKEVNNNYNIQATPIFFILDENRIIREVFRGYGDSTDKGITETINQLI